MKFSKLICSFVVLMPTCTCFAQMYTLTDLGTLGGSTSVAAAINNAGQVVGSSDLIGDAVRHGFRTAPNSPINAATDDLGTLGGSTSSANGINNSGEVVGMSSVSGDTNSHSFRTAPNSAIDARTDDLHPIDNLAPSGANDINDSGQVVGSVFYYRRSIAFRTVPNTPVDLASDDLGNLGSTSLGTYPAALNASGQVVGRSTTASSKRCWIAIPDMPGSFYIMTPYQLRAFRTAANSPIKPATDNLDNFSCSSSASDINAFGQVVGSVQTLDNFLFETDTARYYQESPPFHAFRTSPNQPINLATDDLGTLGGSFSSAGGINNSGEVVGSANLITGANHAFVYSTNTMLDLNTLIAPSQGVELIDAVAINDVGQIVGNGRFGGQQHAFLLSPVYRAFPQQPINGDGSSVFSAKKGVIPVKFVVTQYGAQPSCTLPATLAITRASETSLASIDESTYSMAADAGSNFRIDSTACQYVYNLSASGLGVGTYRVDISINGIMVGHAVFALK